MSSQLVDTERRRLRVTRVVVLKNRSQSRQPSKKTPPLTNRRQLRVEAPHFHHEKFPDSPAPTWEGYKKTSSLGTFLRHHKSDPDAHVSTGRQRLRLTRVAVLKKSKNAPHRSGFIARLMKPSGIKVLAGVLAVLVFSLSWLNSPDTTRMINDPASRWDSIEECYINGREIYWDTPTEFCWVWFMVEAGLIDNCE